MSDRPLIEKVILDEVDGKNKGGLPPVVVPLGIRV